MDLSWVLGHARTSFHHSAKPLSLLRRQPPESNGIAAADTSTDDGKKSSSLSLLDICKESTPPCRLNPLLFNGHLQTFWTVTKHDSVPIYYRRRLFEGEDEAFPGSFAVDFVVEPYERERDDEREAGLPPRTSYLSAEELEGQASDDDRPMLVALHGLSGGSHELYLRHVLALLTARQGEDSDVKGHDNGQRWEACVVNSRGCAGSKLTTPVLYNARATWDVRQVVRWLRRTYPNRPLYGVGFSLGANILVNYLGEEGESCEFNAAVVCSNPWNLEVGVRALQRSWLGMEVYSKTMATNMKRVFEKHFEQVSQNPRIDAEAIRNVKYLGQFDREIQGATWGYPTEFAYYRDASSCDSLLASKTPLFAIHAEDDPISVRESIPFHEIRQSPYTVLCTTSTGGHLGWFESNGQRWFAKAAVNFLKKIHEEADFDHKNANGNADGAPTTKKFDPMRRRMDIRYDP